MGKRLLRISDDLVVSILKGLREPLQVQRRFEVSANALPEDVKILSIGTSPYWPNTVEVFLESDAWGPSEDPREAVDPQLRAIDLQAPRPNFDGETGEPIRQRCYACDGPLDVEILGPGCPGVCGACYRHRRED